MEDDIAIMNLLNKDLLNIQNLSISFRQKEKAVKVVDELSFSLMEGKSIGIVGESGSGKSVTSLAIMGLLPREDTFISGSIHFEGKEILNLSEDKLRSIRGKEISMIFQEPMTSLNPLHTCGNQIMEPLLVHEKGITKQKAKERAIELLQLVGMPSPEQRCLEYPHQMSGGMRQRVMIAIALACNPKLIIADEPTTALDVTIQAQILEIMQDLKKKLNTSIIMITHDLGVVSEICEDVIVMYAGQIVEQSPINMIFTTPLHPYTEGLLNAIPQIDNQRPRLQAIDGVVPDPADVPKGCSFNPRCKYANDRCKKERPPLYNISQNRKVRCFKYDLR